MTKKCFYKPLRQEIIYLKEASPWYGNFVSSHTHYGDLCYGVLPEGTDKTLKSAKALEIMENCSYFHPLMDAQYKCSAIFCEDHPAIVDLKQIDHIVISISYEVMDFDKMTLSEIADQITVKDFKEWIKDMV